MRLLLDTHVLLWSAIQPNKIPAKAASLIISAETLVSVSVVSYWEMSIKSSLGKLALSGDILTVEASAVRQAIDTLPISMLALNRVAILPFHHKDPFDRLIAATSLTIGATLISADALFDTYGVTRLWE